MAKRVLVDNIVELDSNFKELLVKFYETDDMEKIKEWLYENCLDGINPIKI